MNNTLKEWVHTVIIVGWLAWLTSDHFSFKDETIRKTEKVNYVEQKIDTVLSAVEKIEERTRTLEIKNH